jgi:hypothetical protein
VTGAGRGIAAAIAAGVQSFGLPLFHLPFGPCVVFGWVAPSVDEAASRFIHDGHELIYQDSDSRRESLRTSACRRRGLSIDAEDETPTNEDNVFRGQHRGDCAQLDAVVEHLDGRLARTAGDLPIHVDRKRSSAAVGRLWLH